ncbi:MAG: WD40 repeat domain-containing protein, partial [Planctomycetaceae bacterium]|nr:WD40 repeat domain-containing protein [Planctomycetaceae bacterium]
FNGNGVKSLAFSGDGTLLVSGEETGELTFWDLNKKIPFGTIKAHNGPVKMISLRPASNGTRAQLISVNSVTNGANAVAKVWDVEQRELLTSLVGHTTSIDFAHLLPDGRTAVTADKNGECRTWKLDSQTTSEQIPAPAIGISAELQWVLEQSNKSYQEKNKSGVTVALPELHFKVRNRVTGEEKILPPMRVRKNPIQIELFDEGKRLGLLFESELQVWEFGKKEPLFKVASNIIHRGGNEFPYTKYSNLTISPDGRLVAFVKNHYLSSHPDEVSVLESRTGLQAVWPPKKIEGLIGMEFGSDRTLLIATNERQISFKPTAAKRMRFQTRLTRWKINSNRILTQMTENNLPAVNAKNWWLFPDKNIGVCSLAASPTLMVWDLSDFTLSHTIPGQSPNSVCISSDGKRLAGSSGAGIKLWNLRTGEETLTLETTHPSSVVKGFSPDGCTLATKWRGGLELWVGASEGEVDRYLADTKKHESPEK